MSTVNLQAWPSCSAGTVCFEEKVDPLLIAQQSGSHLSWLSSYFSVFDDLTGLHYTMLYNSCPSSHLKLAATQRTIQHKSPSWSAAAFK